MVQYTEKVSLTSMFGDMATGVKSLNICVFFFFFVFF